MSKMSVTLKQIDGLAMAAYAGSKHWIAMDAPKPLGGDEAGSRPMEVMLAGVAGCAAMDVIAIMKKKKVNVQTFQMEVEAERTEEHPQMFTKIHLHYIVGGKDIREEDVKRSIELTDEKYCGAIAVLRPKVEITYHYTISEIKG